ncbi:MAG: 30S ribosomal protein S15 [Nitrospiraceae bacterium]|nr:30S ribosomal protein S15 [Nitrospiraceae bacterium]
MTIKNQAKKQLIHDYRQHATDTGSSEVQIAVITNRISYLTEHFRHHPKDHHSRRGLLFMVSRRRKLLDYLRRGQEDKYQDIIRKLGIRK